MARNNPKVSVVMPVYNVAAYVGRAIESLQAQTMGDFELLVVDDGSKDRSGDICDRMAEKDIRIDVFHTSNGGAPAARNLALDHARGQYVYFMDADDWAEPSMLADMVALADEYNAELVVAGFYIDTFYSKKSNEHLSELKAQPSKVYANQAEFRANAYKLFDENLLYTPWNKLFLRSRIEELGLRFRPTFWDDFPYVLDFIRDAHKVVVTEKAYYHFIRSRAESETARWRPNMYEKREEEHGWMLDLLEHWGLLDDVASKEMVMRRYVERLIGCIENVCNPSAKLSRAQKIEAIRHMISTPHAQEAVQLARPRSRVMRTLVKPIARKNAAQAYIEGSFISFVKRRNTRIFATLKARR
ncbi:glycosyltransferase family 2 protein [Atopobium fossor]|uniref:glycosyltransferase family 2 protein n=1 Tax=Atopobium fossor TaxID=39487 RepID=UPI000406DCE7|nr:glycosyltransferase family 2 protein [Atopobium fossor]